jgi:hypothetical protein
MIAALLLHGCHAAQPLPGFSWNTVPVFFETSNVTGPFDSYALEVLSKANVVVFEKGYNFPSSGFAEDKIMDTASQLRRMRKANKEPAQTIIFYYNSNLDLVDYRLHSVMNQTNGLLRDDAGDLATTHQDAGVKCRIVICCYFILLWFSSRCRFTSTISIQLYLCI